MVEQMRSGHGGGGHGGGGHYAGRHGRGGHYRGHGGDGHYRGGHYGGRHYGGGIGLPWYAGIFSSYDFYPSYDYNSLYNPFYFGVPYSYPYVVADEDDRDDDKISINIFGKNENYINQDYQTNVYKYGILILSLMVVAILVYFTQMKKR
jgi:hypothetical protein